MPNNPGKATKKMISYWKYTTEIYIDDGLTLITGWYDHKNQNEGSYKALGVHWGNYPLSRGILSPCVIPESTRIAMLSGLLYQSAEKNNTAQTKSILEAIRFFNEQA